MGGWVGGWVGGLNGWVEEIEEKEPAPNEELVAWERWVGGWVRG